MEIIKFTPYIYAVKGAKTPIEAAKAVARKRKKSLYEVNTYAVEPSYVGDYGKDELGLWIGGKGNMKNCYSVEL